MRRGVELFRVRSKAKRWLGIGALILTAAFAGLNALAYSHSEAMLRFSDDGLRTTASERLRIPRKTAETWGEDSPGPRADRIRAPSAFPPAFEVDGVSGAGSGPDPRLAMRPRARTSTGAVGSLATASEMAKSTAAASPGCCGRSTMRRQGPAEACY